MFKERRLDAGLAQEKLARLADCSTSTVRLAEKGLLPSDRILTRLAAALGCDVKELRSTTSGRNPPRMARARHEPDEVLTVQEVADRLRIGVVAAYAGVHSGEIPSIRVGKLIRVPRVGLDRLLAETTDTST